MFRSILKYVPKKKILNSFILYSASPAPKVYSSKIQKRDKKRTKKKQQQPTETMARLWINCSDKREITNKYKLVSYNILAQDLLVEHLHLYIQIEQAYLRWEHRSQKLGKELLHINPDIICLQEMQCNHVKNFVAQIGGQRCLEYVFKKKTGTRTDGCAIIYDKSKFKLVQHLGLEYYNSGHNLLNRENIALIAKFDLKEEPGKSLIVATTHLLYNPKREDVRIAQVNVLLKALKQYSMKYENSPIILTGDFNFERHMKPFEIISTAAQHPPLKNSACGDSNEKKGLELIPLDFNLGSECASTFQNKWITVDHIFYSKQTKGNHLEILEICRLPTIKDCQMFGQIPNRFLGSDHYSLAFTFSVQ
ncbi:protein angel-like [Teleopsis dalmanni]|uniref:protein angel-like n=1 Tax=Teleopsis dalmanni TaxID=139649 RepID=UPI0018CCFFB4|nr:protein angel-like [Teleopsis dalmanni]XP_037946821.1 protein angel-like [Teleopsis dalmanni]